MKGFAKLGHAKASRSHYHARKLVKKTLKKWRASSGSAPRTTPVRPTSSRSSVSEDRLALQNALVAAVRAVYGASTSVSSAKAVLKTQKWSTLKQLGIASNIQKAFGRLGYGKASKNSYIARRLLKKTLKKWK